jgi:hypothetical protein
MCLFKILGGYPIFVVSGQDRRGGVRPSSDALARCASTLASALDSELKARSEDCGVLAQCRFELANIQTKQLLRVKQTLWRFS